MSTKTIDNERHGYDVKKLVVLAMFVALAYASLFVVHLKLQFLSFEPKDALIIISSLMYGPLAGVGVAVVTSFIEMLTMSTTGLYGFVMNIAGSATLAAVSGFIYKHKRTVFGAVVSLVAAVAVMVSVMVVTNIIITPIYMGVPRQTVIGLITPLLIPFNVVKGIFNASLTMILYKPFVTALRAAGMLPKGSATAKPGKGSFIIMIIAAITAVATLMYFLFVLEGSVSWGK